jgi:hypothetical protein
MKNRFLSSRIIIALVLVLAAVGPLNFVHALSSGPPPSYSGAPGEGNCTICHNSYLVDTGTAGFSISVPETFVPGSTNAVNITFSGSTSVKHGFQVTARNGNDVWAGTWQVAMPNMTKNATGGAHHEHTALGNTLSAWTMNWIAPATLPNGPITFYTAGNQTDSSFSPSGDYIYTRKTSTTSCRRRIRHRIPSARHSCSKSRPTGRSSPSRSRRRRSSRTSTAPSTPQARRPARS